MAREVTWGTPDRSRRLPPRRHRYSPLVTLGLLGATLGTLFAIHGMGRRGVASPGPLTSAHAASETRCQECHTLPGGVSNVRCQRCHDPAGAERLSHRAHVLAARKDPASSASAESLRCGACHREHRGRAASLRAPHEGQCARCHFRGIDSHPEFAVLRDPKAEVTGLSFSHRRHIEELAKRGLGIYDTCTSCHQPSSENRDIRPISFDRHCASCHAQGGSLGSTAPLAPEDVETPTEIAEFQSMGGRILKTVVRHRDAWVLASLRRLRWQLDPQGAGAERAALEARMSRLRRRLALSTPLAGLDLPGLKAREADLRLEIAQLEERLRAQSSGGGLESGLGRLSEVAEAAAATQDPDAANEAEALRSRAETLKHGSIEAQPLPAHEHEERRVEMLVVLDILDAVEPQLKLRTQDLRRRLLALSPGESTEAVVSRALAQRLAEIERVQDEMRLRESGVAPPGGALLAEVRRAIEDALAEAEARLAQIGTDAGERLTPEALEAKRGSLETLVAQCAKCHRVERGALASPKAAHPVFVRSTFVHEPHLGHASCESCHAGVEASRVSSDLNFRGIVRCRECHTPAHVRSSCQHCHRYHPRVIP